MTDGPYAGVRAAESEQHWQNKNMVGDSVTSGTSLGGAKDSPSYIRDRVTTIEDLMSRLHKGVSDLEVRLDTVMYPVPPRPAQNSSDPVARAGGSSNLYSRLEEIARGVDWMATYVASLTSRIEV